MDRRVEFNSQDEVFILPPSPMSGFPIPFGDTFMLDGDPESDLKHSEDPFLPLGSTFELCGEGLDVSTTPEVFSPGSNQELFPIGDTFVLGNDTAVQPSPTGKTYLLGPPVDVCPIGDTFSMDFSAGPVHMDLQSIPEGDTFSLESEPEGSLPLGASFPLQEKPRAIQFQELNLSSDESQRMGSLFSDNEQSEDAVPMGDVFALHGDTAETPMPHGSKRSTSPDPIGQLIHRGARKHRYARNESLLDIVTESGRRAREIVMEAGVDVRGADPIAFTLLGEYMAGHGWPVETVDTGDDQLGLRQAIVSSFQRINDRAQHHRLLLKYDILLLEMLEKVQKRLV